MSTRSAGEGAAACDAQGKGSTLTVRITDSTCTASSNKQAKRGFMVCGNEGAAVALASAEQTVLQCCSLSSQLEGGPTDRVLKYALRYTRYVLSTITYVT